MKLRSAQLSCIFLFLILFCASVNGEAQVTYPYPLQKFTVPLDDTAGQMAYMDVKPASQVNGKAIVLLHGKNFNGYYWKDVIPVLIKAGYRVIVPDQVGWGRSDKPVIH